jgi:hypothetical protein
MRRACYGRKSTGCGTVTLSRAGSLHALGVLDA